MGIMVTYGSYVKDDVDLNKSINQIEIFDTGVAFLAGMMIIPAVFVFLGTDGMASGPSLIFISLPKVFASMGAIGRIVAIAFFLMMGFAALTSVYRLWKLWSQTAWKFSISHARKCVLSSEFILLLPQC